MIGPRPDCLDCMKFINEKGPLSYRLPRGDIPAGIAFNGASCRHTKRREKKPKPLF